MVCNLGACIVLQHFGPSLSPNYWSTYNDYLFNCHLSLFGNIAPRNLGIFIWLSPPLKTLSSSAPWKTCKRFMTRHFISIVIIICLFFFPYRPHQGFVSASAATPNQRWQYNLFEPIISTAMIHWELLMIPPFAGMWCW